MVTTTTDPVFLLFFALVALVAFACLVYGVRELQFANHVLRSRPDSVLETTQGGPVELRGTATSAGGTLRSPFTDTPCLAYEYEVEEEYSTKNGTSWRTIDSGDRYVPFRLEDGSGSVLIEPPGASFRLTAEDRVTVKGGTTPPAEIQRFIDATEDVDCQNTSVDLRVFELRTGSDRRFTERRLDVDEEVHVLGTARYDTTISRGTGEVNAAVGIDEAALSDSRWVRIRHRLFGYPFVISDRSERSLGLRAALVGGSAVVGGLLLVAFAALFFA
ncbi:GIDE domain-containing protein [Natronoglomus mannanivorans]|uniref:RING-type E3 ubiquitin transferase n=1 Tax=Natronoglomus mannanivorans TaxID=2979990 RepID=A0AAP2Z0D5_9EURY|nr:E3 ubiquitin ligase family protein [Halobacteria archaeon AArc-xg1-1]